MQARRAADLITAALSTPSPATPSARQIGDVGRPSAKRAIAAEHRTLVAAGMPRKALTDNIQATAALRGDSLASTATRADEGPSRISDLGKGIDILMAGIGEPLLQGWAVDGADLIRTMLPIQARSTVPLVVEAVVQGRRWESLTDAMMRLGARSRAGARLIARDQVARLNGQITESMHKAAGVEEYVWLTGDDERVRESHRAVDGQRFRRHVPGAPDVGFYGESAHAGQAGQCRCRSRPVPPPGNAWAERPVRKPTYRAVQRR
jgi:SPP1 gp7 family putative phage head morphogenesis protein